MLLAEQEVDPAADELESLPSFDPVPDDHEVRSANGVFSDHREEPLDIVLARSRSRERRKKRAEAKRLAAEVQLRKSIRIMGLLVIPVLTILALLSLRPYLPGSRPPPPDSYADILPIRYLYRLRDTDEMVFIVSPSWNSLDQERRLRDLTELYQRANEHESITSIVVRGTEGVDLAHVEEGVPVLLP